MVNLYLESGCLLIISNELHVLLAHNSDEFNNEFLQRHFDSIDSRDFKVFVSDYSSSVKTLATRGVFNTMFI